MIFLDFCQDDPWTALEMSLLGNQDNVLFLDTLTFNYPILLLTWNWYLMYAEINVLIQIQASYWIGYNIHNLARLLQSLSHKIQSITKMTVTGKWLHICQSWSIQSSAPFCPAVGDINHDTNHLKRISSCHAISIPFIHPFQTSWDRTQTFQLRKIS